MIGVTELSLHGRGPRRGYVFDAHRLALPCWAEACQGQPALLVSFDRHFDTVPPANPLPPGSTLPAIEHHAHHRLDPRNFDHVVAALDAGLLSHAVLLARARPEGSLLDARMTAAPSLDALLQGRQAEQALSVVRGATRVLLDFDLDCFTTLSDADPTSVVPWTEELIAQHLLPRGSDVFWDTLLPKCVALTFAREPYHCGGLVASGRLFETAARVVFEKLLRTDLP